MGNGNFKFVQINMKHLLYMINAVVKSVNFYFKGDGNPDDNYVLYERY